ncbi:hypothetical protein Pan216_57600 [Planctomycetes bacterium Pan216]|uniref:Response regulatory domain-containing protein n=1 Tax=Kolteria novifilia TaxID=2527975 RepID=A0A518BD25_9BACT|nr:hypothetical protein Pan216_57600 [Planctomycetes bacterium Pan216]
MPKRVLNVGQCAPDHGSITHFIESSFDAKVDRGHLLKDSLEKLGANDYALVLVNRKLDADYSDGIEIIKHLKADERFRDLPCMLVSNYPEWQEKAVEAGAAPGFGKSELRQQQTREKLATILDSRS